jgi:hypothetical protein
MLRKAMKLKYFLFFMSMLIRVSGKKILDNYQDFATNSLLSSSNQLTQSARASNSFLVTIPSCCRLFLF